MRPAAGFMMPERLIEYSTPPEPGVRIWTVSLDGLSSAESAELEALLDDSERERAARFHFERDRQHFIAARGYLRQLVGAALEISATSVRFVYGARGKPETGGAALDGRILRFNLSHAAGWGMFALAWNREVGIDLESTRRLAAEDEHLSALAARVLSERELAIWRKLPDAATRQVAFLRGWTRKEALSKATGEGLFEGLREIEAILDAATPEPSLIIARRRAGGSTNWVLYDLKAPDGFVAAVAIARS